LGSDYLSLGSRGLMISVIFAAITASSRAVVMDSDRGWSGNMTERFPAENGSVL
jgi:hypothetical protein